MSTAIERSGNAKKKAPVVTPPQRMFASEKTKRVHLNDDQWIDIKESLLASDVMNGSLTQEGDEFSKSVDFLLKVVVNWRLLDEEGNEVPFARDAITKLNVPAAMFLLQECNRAIGLSETMDEQKKE